MAEPLFEKEISYQTFRLTYDYNSIMHEDSFFASKNSEMTIVPLDPNITLIPIDQRDDSNILTVKDIKTAQKLYQCSNYKFTLINDLNEKALIFLKLGSELKSINILRRVLKTGEMYTKTVGPFKHEWIVQVENKKKNIIIGKGKFKERVTEIKLSNL